MVSSDAPMHLLSSGHVRLLVANPAPHVVEHAPTDQSLHSHMGVEHDSDSVTQDSSPHGSLMRSRVPPPHLALHASHAVHSGSTTVELFSATSAWTRVANKRDDASFMPSFIKAV